MATIKVEVTYDPKKETLSQALASLLTEKPEHTEITAQMSLFDNPAPTETPTAQASTEVPQESPAESAPEDPDTKPAEEKTISKADVRALAVKLSKNDKAALKAIFKELGVANLSAVKEEDYLNIAAAVAARSTCLRKHYCSARMRMISSAFIAPPVSKRLFADDAEFAHRLR